MTFFDTMWIVVTLLVSLNHKCSRASYSNLSKELQEMELERQLNLLNKQPFETFQTKEGEIIDCIDINNQPALDHPLLKDHKVQTRPSTYPYGSSKDSSQSTDDSFINNNIRKPCPIGFVPIRRTLKKDLIGRRSQSLKQLNEIKYDFDAVTFPSNQNVVSLSLKRGKYYGASGYASVYNLSVAQDQSSSANIWLVGGPPEALNVILVGWQVDPTINGDSLTRLFVYWTADGSTATGCYNMLCPGFVQVDRIITPDYPLYPSSTYQGQQYDYLFIVYQDRRTGNWWLQASASQRVIGYWPKELFPHLNDGAEQVAWGGIAKPSPNGLSPPLGNGHMPNGFYNEASYFVNIKYIQDNNISEFPAFENTVSYVSNSNCYGLYNNKNCRHDQLYYCFTFGGPGGNNCRA